MLAIDARDVLFAILALADEVEDLFQRRGSIW
jgi:hypothetical protein